ncbi:MAG: hypothetical protein ABIS50_17675 [Luteolibacter sp.]|uniref:hypothetical protein n=1 Tax=Luteolibacter sp. TaxID=1962973 RepID=UPI0032631308
MDFFPATRKLAASLQGFVQMQLFALLSAIVAAYVLGDIQKLSLSVAIGWPLSVLCWRLGTRKGLVCHREVVEEADEVIS